MDVAVYLDRVFPSLDAVITKLDSESERLQKLDQQHKEAVIEATCVARNVAEQETQNRRSALQNAIRTRSITDPNGDLSVEHQLTKLRDLKDLKEALELSEAVTAPSTTRDSLLKFESRVRDISATASNPEIIAACDEVVSKIGALLDPEIKEKSAEFTKALAEDAQWPHHNPASPSVEQTLEKLLVVERPSSHVLTAFEVLAAPLRERIQFNFESDRDTARADKPEWLLGYFSKLIDPHRTWLKTSVQPILRKSLPTRQGTGGAVGELARALLPQISRALRGYFAAVTDQPELMRHIVSESLAFDAMLKDQYYISESITADILGGDFFNVFSAAEHHRALEGLVGALEQGNEIDYDADCASAKPTFSAQIVKQLFDDATNVLRASDDALCTMQLDIIYRVHLPLLEGYLEHLLARYRKFTAAKSSLARTVRAVTKEEAAKVVGMQGLSILSKLYGASAYARQFLAAANCDLHFVRLQFAFDAAIEQFSELHADTGKEIAKILGRELSGSIPAYLRTDWHLATSAAVEPSPELVHALGQMRPMIAAVDALCASSQADKTRVLVQFASYTVGDIFWRQVINANRFTNSGGRQLLVDIQNAWTTLELPTSMQIYERLVAAALILTGAEYDEQDTRTLSDEDAQDLRRRRID